MSKQVVCPYHSQYEFVVAAQRVLMKVDIILPSGFLLITLGWHTVVVFYEAWTKGRFFFVSFLFLVLGLNLEPSNATKHSPLSNTNHPQPFKEIVFSVNILKNFKHTWLRWFSSSVLCLNFNNNQFWVCLTCWNRNVCLLKVFRQSFLWSRFLSRIPGWPWGNASVPLVLCYVYGLFCLLCVFTLVFFAIFFHFISVMPYHFPPHWFQNNASAERWGG